VRILHLTTFLQGGAGRVVVDLASTQTRQGHDVVVVASRTEVPGYGHYPEFIARLVHARVPLWLVDSTFHRDAADNLRAVELVNRLARTAPFDVIHAHAAVPSLVGLIAAGHARQPLRIVQTMHGWGVAKTTAQTDADVRVMNLVDRVVVPSTHASEQIAAFGVAADHIRIIPYGVSRDASPLENGDAVLAAEITARRRRGTFVLACVGTIGERKNQALLVEALASLDRSVDIFTVFVGDGDHDGLRTRVARADLGARVAVREYTPASRALARLTDAIVLPSRNEGQPLTALEAFADRVLMIASDVPALAELVVDGRTGLRHRSDDAASLAVTIERARRLTTRARDRMLDQAQTYHATHATIDAMARRYMSEYQAVRPVAVAS
jgi:glycosyltransferase involved in cell wall biosynthesis